MYVNSSSDRQFLHTRVGTPIIVTNGSRTFILQCLQTNASALSYRPCAFLYQCFQAGCTYGFLQSLHGQQSGQLFLLVGYTNVNTSSRASVGLLASEIHTHTNKLESLLKCWLCGYYTAVFERSSHPLVSATLFSRGQSGLKCRGSKCVGSTSSPPYLIMWSLSTGANLPLLCQRG